MRLSCTVMEIWRGNVTLSVTWPFDSGRSTSYRWSIVTMCLSGTLTEIRRLKDNGITTLTFWGYVTSSVTWPFDSRGSTSYGWSIVTMRLSCTVMEIWRLKYWTHGRGHGKNKKGKEKEEGGREGKGKGTWKEKNS